MKKSSAPKPPAHLSAEAKRVWKALHGEFALDDPAALALLRSAMEAFDRAEGARRQIEREGQTLPDRFGQLKAHPLLATERDARAQFLAALRQLNLDVEPLNDRPGRPPGTFNRTVPFKLPGE